jgi:pimeloyl-ACP methyl ester carboxylesterase
MAAAAKPRLRPATRRRRKAPDWVPEPPVELPPGRVVHIPERGEVFYRDSGGDGPAVLLLHGWVVSADLNWFTAYQPLIDAGYRVIALDHRGHGRGLRPHVDFRLRDCADDAAALLETLGIERALVAGYSMGGPIASLLTRQHPDRTEGLVLCATAPDWSEPGMRAIWAAQGVVRIVAGLFPRGVWRVGIRLAGFPDSPGTAWFESELSRGSALDIAEAGRELGRYDAKPWLAELAAPSAVLVTTRDRSVPPRKQRELARLLGARMYEVHGDHAAVTVNADEFNRELLRALADLRDAAGSRPAGDSSVAA